MYKYLHLHIYIYVDIYIYTYIFIQMWIWTSVDCCRSPIVACILLCMALIWKINLKDYLIISKLNIDLNSIIFWFISAYFFCKIEVEKFQVSIYEWLFLKVSDARLAKSFVISASFSTGDDKLLLTLWTRWLTFQDFSDEQRQKSLCVNICIYISFLNMYHKVCFFPYYFWNCGTYIFEDKLWTVI